jgi:hypothetical protein
MMALHGDAITKFSLIASQPIAAAAIEFQPFLLAAFSRHASIRQPR